MRVFKNKPFMRFARKVDLNDAALCEAIASAERGLIDANLGGGVIKQRVARPGKGQQREMRRLPHDDPLPTGQASLLCVWICEKRTFERAPG
jgi:hypothetical protein